MLSHKETRCSSVEAGPIHLDSGTLDLVVIAIVTGGEVLEFNDSRIQPSNLGPSWLSTIKQVSKAVEATANWTTYPYGFCRVAS